MKLSKIYSSKKNFKQVIFNDHFNVILGKIKNPEDLNADTHNLGKTTLISIIDFLLLSKYKKGSYFYKHLKTFNEYIFFLEIELNSGSYLTIRRSVINPNSICFKRHNAKHQDFSNEEIWDYQDLPFAKAVNLLDTLLAFDVLKDHPYRRMLGYVLRTQADYFDVFHLYRQKGDDSEWKPLLLDLLGFNGTLLKDKYEIDNESTAERKIIEEISQKFSVSTEEVDKIKGAIQLKQAEKKQINQEVDQFRFFLHESQINTDLVENIEQEISELNSKKYYTDFEINKISTSLDSKFKFDIDEIKALFEEVKVTFPSSLVKDYEDVIQFNKKLAKERNKYLKERLTELKTEQEEIQDRLVNLDQKRSSILSVLRERDTFKKFKEYQKSLSSIEADLANLENQLEQVEIIKKITSELKKKKDEAEHIVESLQSMIETGNTLYAGIRETFASLVKVVLNQPALLSISLNEHGNPEFNTEITGLSEEDITAKGDGTSYKKVLCVCFDFALILNYSKSSFFRFVYHDGVLEGLDNRKKIRFLAEIKKLCEKNNLQYILTTIEDDTPNSPSDEVSFIPEDIAVELSDDGDNGKLFGMTF